MSALEEMVADNTRDELVDKATEYNIDPKREDGTQKNKTELAEAIIRFETGVPAQAEVGDPDNSEGDESDNSDDELEALVNDPADDVQDDEGEKVEDSPGSDEEVLVKYTGKANAFQVGRHIFGKRNPFKVVDGEYAEMLFNHRHAKFFRPATPAEAKDFYN